MISKVWIPPERAKNLKNRRKWVSLKILFSYKEAVQWLRTYLITNSETIKRCILFYLSAAGAQIKQKFKCAKRIRK